MQTLFSPDSKFMQAMSRIADLVLLNLVFLLCSLPVFTIGASLTAMYTVCFRYGTARENGTFRPFFEAFRANFRQATVLWLILLVCIGSSAFNAMLFYVMPGGMHWLWIPCAVLLLLAVMILSYAFPLLSQFDSSCRRTLSNALVMSIGYLPRSLALVVLNAFPFVLILTDLYVFFQAGLIWFILYFAAAAYLGSRILKPVFAPYQEEAE